MQAAAKPRPLPGAAITPGCASCSVASSCSVVQGGGCGAGAKHNGSGPSPSSSSCSSSCSGAAASPSSSSRALPLSQSQQLASSNGACSGSSALKGRGRVRMLEQQKKAQQRQQKQGERDRDAARRGGHGKKKERRRVHLNLSAKLLAGIAGLWVLATTLLLTVPETQGLLTYLHWVHWPVFRDLTDLVSFRLPHARNIRVRTSDGVELGGWHVLPSHKVAAEASRLPLGSRAREEFFDAALARPGARVVLYFHGNAATRGQFNRVELVKALAGTMEAHVIAIDYRGFGDSTGWPSEAGLGLDARAVWTWVQERVGGREGGRGGAANVYLYGHSLGSSVALGLAEYLSEEAVAAAAGDDNQASSSSSRRSNFSLPVVPTGLILDAAFTNLSMAALHHPSALPFRLLPFVKHALLHSMHERFPSLEYIQRVDQPILILHGRRDRMIPFFLGQELYHAAQLARVRRQPELLEDLWFSEFGEAGHNDVYAHGQWTNDLHAFMETMDGGGGREGGREG